MTRIGQQITLGIMTGIAGLVMGGIFMAFHLDESWDLFLLFRIRGARTAPPEVAVVSIDRTSAARLSVHEDPGTWPRSLHGVLTERLSRGGASVIVFDLFFHEPRSEDDDALFARAAGSAGNVVLAEYLRHEVLVDKEGKRIDTVLREKRMGPIPRLAGSAAAVAGFPLPKYPHRVNQYWTFRPAGGGAPTLPIAAFQVYSSSAYDDLVRMIREDGPHHALESLPPHKEAFMNSAATLGTMKALREAFEKDPALGSRLTETLTGPHAPPARTGSTDLVKAMIRMYQDPASAYLNFYGPPRTIQTIPYYQAVQPGTSAADSGEQFDFRGKAVFVGLSEIMESEKRNDSFSTVFSLPNGVDISGVEIAATAFANILEDRPLQPLSRGLQFTIIFFWGFFAGIVMDRLVPSVLSPREVLLPLASICGAGLVYALAARQAFADWDIWCPLSVPLLQAPLAFFGAAVMRTIDRERTGYGIYLYTDVRDFTSLSENMDPHSLKNLMGGYFSLLSGIIERRGGVLESAPGDALLARWEIRGPSHASGKERQRACRAALDIARAVSSLTENPDIQLSSRIGVHCGPASRGYIGSRHQRKNISFGDTVNTAQRAEEMNKCLGTQVLVSGDMAAGLHGFLTRYVGRFELKGKSKAVELHELLCPVDRASPEDKRLCNLFSEALDAFHNRSWDEASLQFDRIISEFGGDGPSLRYASLCKSYKSHPPDEAWSGAVCQDDMSPAVPV
ncbi:MAG: adenylate/guanylate cyclase domain-containing protein [Nitrospiraceae bacterium]|nr:MAG: adenylate/guanylate cyclase domain-containing protein [Nitrospiraceae bacterium]